MLYVKILEIRYYYIQAPHYRFQERALGMLRYMLEVADEMAYDVD